MSNINTAVKANETALTSQGSAMNENSKYMESFEAHVANLSAKWQSFSNDVVNSDFAKFLMDRISDILSLADTGLGQVITQITLLTSLGWGATSLLKAMKIVSAAKKQFETFGAVISLVREGSGTLTEAISAAGGAASVALPAIAAITAAIVVLGKVIPAVANAIEEAIHAASYEGKVEAFENAIEEADRLQNKYEQAKNRLQDLNAVPWENRTPEIQAEIDKVKNDTSRQGQLRLKQLLEDYENQQKIINDKIKEQQNQAINDRFDAEEELLDKELEDMTSAENLSQMVADAISKGMIKIGDETISVKNSMNDMLKETEVGFANVALQQSEWLDNLEQIETLYSSISSIMTNAGMVMPSYDNVSRSMDSRSINITTGGITITGNVDNSTLGSIQDMLDAQAKEIYKNIAKQLS